MYACESFEMPVESHVRSYTARTFMTGVELLITALLNVFANESC